MQESQNITYVGMTSEEYPPDTIKRLELMRVLVDRHTIQPNIAGETQRLKQKCL